MYLLFNTWSRLVISCGSLYNQDIYVSLPVTMTDCWQYTFMVSTILSHLSTQCNHFSADILFYFVHSLKLFTKASLLSINANSKFFTICGLVYIDLLFNMGPMLLFLWTFRNYIYWIFWMYIFGNTFFQILSSVIFLWNFVPSMVGSNIYILMNHFIIGG